MLDYRRIRKNYFFAVVFILGCQTSPRSAVQNSSEPKPSTVPVEAASAQEAAVTTAPVMTNKNLAQFVRTPSLIYFDPNGSLNDITETLELLSYDGATFGWTIPLRPEHSGFLMRENLLQLCIDGKKKFSTSTKTVKSKAFEVSNYRDFGPKDCRGVYVYEVLFFEEVILRFQISIM
ncbi:MAG: hypothetical protein ACK5P5_04045 [Pseudobdellovibrionaceae bacterium]